MGVTRRYIYLILLLPAIALAGLPYEATLEEMAGNADHILIGRVIGVDMINGKGKQVTNTRARTGPGSNNTIRLLITVDEVLVSNADHVPTILPVPLANHLHYSLGQIRDALKGDAPMELVLLRGSDFSAIKPGVFLWSVSDKDRALELYHASRH